MVLKGVTTNLGTCKKVMLLDLIRSGSKLPIILDLIVTFTTDWDSAQEILLRINHTKNLAEVAEDRMHQHLVDIMMSKEEATIYL